MAEGSETVGSPLVDVDVGARLRGSDCQTDQIVVGVSASLIVTTGV
jgi:hypothetical protein